MYRFEIQQIDRDGRTAVLVGCIPFVDLINKVRFTYRSSDIPDGNYQRRIDMSRVKDIANFVRKSISCKGKGTALPIFPTSVILAFGSSVNIFDNVKQESVEIDKLPEDILIVDGQHRFAAIDYLYKEVKNRITGIFVEENDSNILEAIEHFKFSCSILLNYDIWEQAQVFASVNFNQKKVNKSLFYDIYGIKFPDNSSNILPKQNEIYIAHQLVSYLNSSKESPFRGFVKMLGTGNGFISQAFLVEQFLKHLSIGGIWYDVTEDLRNGNKLNLQNYAAAELSAYLAAIRFTFINYWPNNKIPKRDVSVLCKTTGIGAIMMFLEDLHNQMDADLLGNLKADPSDPTIFAEVIAYFNDNVYPLKNAGERLFSIGEKGEYKGTGGKGLQTNLYKDLLNLWKFHRG